MQTSQRWPIGTTGALWLAFLLVVGHYLAMFGVGGVLTILLGIAWLVRSHHADLRVQGDWPIHLAVV